MEILKIIETLQSYSEDAVAYKLDGAFAHAVSEAVELLVKQGEKIAELEEQNRWIPVTEKLPEIPDGWLEHPDPVLYMMKSTKTIYAGYYGENGTYRDKYFRQYADRYEGVDASDVLCWMWQKDLMEPPQSWCYVEEVPDKDNG